MPVSRPNQHPSRESFVRHRNIFVFICLAMLIGCGSLTSTLLMRQTPNQRPSLIDVPADGAYSLFITGETEPVLSFTLTKSEKIGFELSQAAVVGDVQIDQVYAIAGQNRFPLDITKAYEWRKQ
jgi:hypothetical protein